MGSGRTETENGKESATEVENGKTIDAKLLRMYGVFMCICAMGEHIEYKTTITNRK